MMSRGVSSDFNDEEKLNALETLDKAIDTIYDKQPFNLSYEQLYRHAYNLVLNRQGDTAYKNITVSLQRNFSKYIYRLSLLQKNDEDLLSAFVAMWEDVRLMMKLTSDIFLYLDKNWVIPKKLVPVRILGYELFRKMLLEENSELYDRMLKRLFIMIKRERDGDTVSRALIRNTVLITIELGLMAKITPNIHHGQIEYIPNFEIYEKKLESRYIVELESYYKLESSVHIATLSCNEYLQKAERRFQEEKERAAAYLEEPSIIKVIKIFIAVYIEDHIKALIEMDNSGLKFLIKQSRFSDLQKMYSLCQISLKAFEMFQTACHEFLTGETLAILEQNNSKKDHLNLIEKLLEHQEKLNNMHKLSFSSKNIETDHVMIKILKKSQESVFNKNMSVNQALNKYLDYCFVNGFRNKSELEIENTLLRLMEIFKLIQNKDVFELLYKTLLAKRLLNNKYSNETEENLLKKLKLECGSYYTSKIEVMLKDIQISNHINAQLKPVLNRQTVPFEFEIKVLTMGNWPYENCGKFRVPLELQPITKLFENFYIRMHQTRTITWNFYLGLATLRATFNDKKKELIVSTPQMAILLLYNTRNAYTFLEFQSLTLMDKAELKRNILPLIDLSILIRNKDSKAELEDKETLLFNDNFNHKSYKIKVPTKKAVEKEEVPDLNMEGLYIERKFLIDATITRIMKARKRMQISQLIEEVVRISSPTHFVPTISMIKNSIESLIDRDYLKRGDDRNLIEYLS